MLWAFFSPRKIYACFLRILNWSANESKTLLLSDQSLEGRCWMCRPRGRGVEAHRGWFWEEWGVSGDRSKQCYEWGTWSIKYNDINNLAKITRRLRNLMLPRSKSATADQWQSCACISLQTVQKLHLYTTQKQLSTSNEENWTASYRT
jgi:hypothetical protein